MSPKGWEMKRSIAVAVLGLATVAMAAPAQAKNLYMVKDVGQTDGVYYGDFVAVDKTGTKVVGAVGAFSSEYTCFKGTVKNGRLKAMIYEDGQPVAAFTRKWVGAGPTQRIKGMTRVSAAQVTVYLEGTHPKSFIADCKAMVG